MTNYKLDHQLQKLKTVIESEKKQLKMYEQGLIETRKSYIFAYKRLMTKQRKVELKIDQLHYELRQLIKGGIE